MTTAGTTKGVFITFEGGEGTGKSTQIARLADHLRACGRDVISTREPGGSKGAEVIRHVLLSGAAARFGVEMEAILFAAARADHVATLIRPSLEKGRIVLCDRFHDSTRVYQGVSGVEPDLIESLERVALDGVIPDLTLILDLPAALGLDRAGRRRGAAPADRFEKEHLAVQEARRTSFLRLAEQEPQRCVVIDGARPVDEIADDVAKVVEERFNFGAPLGNARRHKADAGKGTSVSS